MPIDSEHPQYTQQSPIWVKMADTLTGEDHIKSKDFAYLRPTQAQEIDGAGTKTNPTPNRGRGNIGWNDYLRYRDRALFPEFVADALGSLTGIMHRKPAKIEVPEKMEPLLESIDLDGSSAQAFLRRINEAQLLNGRYGILVEVPSNRGPDAQPYLVGYTATEIINWDKGDVTDGPVTPILYVINESGQFRDGFEWKDETKYRELFLDFETGLYTVNLYDGAVSKTEPVEMIEPQIGGRRPDFIPFTIVNSGDLVLDVGTVPLSPLANAALSIYRSEADYRQALHAQAQDTFVTIGAGLKEGEEVRLGSGARLDLPPDADAKFVGVDSKGLPEMRTSIENDRKAAAQLGARLLSDEEGGTPSGDALRIRVAAQTASLTNIANTGALALQDALKQMAFFMGVNPDEIKVTPNLDFAAGGLTGRELLDFVGAKIAGAPLSDESIHQLMRQGDVTTKSFDEEKALLDADGGVLGNDE